MYYAKADSMPSAVLVYSPAGVNSHALLTSLECVLLSHCDKALGIKKYMDLFYSDEMLHFIRVVELSLDS